MQEEIWHECLVCGDTITNQICYRCIEVELEKWLLVRSPGSVDNVKRVGDFFASYFHEGGNCIMCGENLNTCSKCYCSSVHQALRKNRILASEFLDFAASKGFMLTPVKGVLNLQG